MEVRVGGSVARPPLQVAVGVDRPAQTRISGLPDAEEGSRPVAVEAAVRLQPGSRAPVKVRVACRAEQDAAMTVDVAKDGLIRRVTLAGHNVLPRRKLAIGL